MMEITTPFDTNIQTVNCYSHPFHSFRRDSDLRNGIVEITWLAENAGKKKRRG